MAIVKYKRPPVHHGAPHARNARKSIRKTPLRGRALPRADANTARKAWHTGRQSTHHMRRTQPRTHLGHYSQTTRSRSVTKISHAAATKTKAVRKPYTHAKGYHISTAALARRAGKKHPHKGSHAPRAKHHISAAALARKIGAKHPHRGVHMHHAHHAAKRVRAKHSNRVSHKRVNHR
jgi:hypothetical protein